MERRKLNPAILVHLDEKLFSDRDDIGSTVRRSTVRLRDALVVLRNVMDGQYDPEDIKRSTGLPDADCDLAASIGAMLANTDDL